jgi:uncharacterized Rossmann fold enzyme
MDRHEWFNTWYPRLIRELGLNPEADADAARLLDNLTGGVSTCEADAQNMIRGKTCVVFGAGPSLAEWFGGVHLDGSVSVAADGAARIFMEKNATAPHVLVTDLDGGDDVVTWCATNGSILVVHAHGDNTDALRRLVPALVALKAKLILTCQVEPVGKLKNYYGFTDGDRAAWFCHAMGAHRIILVGMDFGSRIGEYSKPAGHPAPRLKQVKLGLGLELLQRLAREANLYTLRGSPRLAGIPEASCPEGRRSLPGGS